VTGSLARVVVAVAVTVTAWAARAGEVSPEDGPALDPLAAFGVAVPACEASRGHCLPIRLYVALTEHGPAATPAFIAGQLAAANHHFAAIDVAFQLAGVSALPARTADIATRAQRSALARHRERGAVIHVFVVGRLADIDIAGATINGVAWRHAAGATKYLILSATAWERTLAHELGHYFGLPHSSYPISIMNKTPRDEPPHDQRTFADEELAAMRPVVARLVRDKVIAPVARRP
jgi:hypothetical protein